jgi:WD40 repeat protein
LYGLIQDASRFILYNRSIIEDAPLQLYSSALIFAPSRSKVQDRFLPKLPDWICRLPEVPTTWDSTVQTVEGHTTTVRGVAFSPKGHFLASVSLGLALGFIDKSYS